MTPEDYAEFIRTTHWILGIGLCLTIVLAPLGIWLIREGRRKSKQILATRLEDSKTNLDRALEIGIASSLDDIVGPESLHD